MASITAIDRSAGFPERRVSQAGLASLRRWLEQIVLTLPEPRQRMYDLFVARDLDTRSAALELGTSVAEVRRLRRENRQAVLRAFEVTVLVAAESAPDRPWNTASGCRELREMLDAGQHDGDLREAGRHRFVVLSAALRVTVSRHLSQCTACQLRRDDCMASWAPELLAVMGGADLSEPVAQDVRPMQRPGQHRSASGLPRRGASAGTARTVTARRAAATGAGLLAALPLLAFVWPGFAHGQHASVPPSSLALSGQSSITTPQAAATADGVAGDGHGRPVRHGASGLPSTPSPQPTASMSAQLYTPLPPSAYYTLPPSASPTPSLGQQTSGPSPTSASPSPSPSSVSSSPKPRKTSPAPHPATSTAPSSQAPTATPTSTASSPPSPTPSASPSAPDSATPSSPAPSSPDPAASDSGSDPAPSPAPESSTPAPTDPAAS